MNLHVAYQFAAGAKSGFGDIVIAGVARSIREPADIESLKNRIRGLLVEDGCRDPTVVILGWTEMWPAGGGEP